MLSTLMVTAVLACKPYLPPRPVAPPPEVTVACEGLDQVRRSLEGAELSRARFSPACSFARCEGGDLVRRDSRGVEWVRWALAPSCAPPPVKLTREATVRFGLSSR